VRRKANREFEGKGEVKAMVNNDEMWALVPSPAEFHFPASTAAYTRQYADPSR
jgi:hypothetical protein